MNRIILKECPKHGLTEFVLVTRGNYRCKECRKERVLDQRRRNKIELVKYKGGKCEICGYDKCIDALEFHHLDPKEKDFGLSNGDTRSLEKLKMEADKCILICANCHRELHAKEREEIRQKNEEKMKKQEEEFYVNHSELIGKFHQSRRIENILNSDEIKKDIDGGLNKQDLCKKYNISLTSLRRYLNNHDLYFYESINKSNKITIENFVENFRKYGSFVKVAKQYDLTDNSIRKWCRKNDIPWRKTEIMGWLDKQP